MKFATVLLLQIDLEVVEEIEAAEEKLAKEVSGARPGNIAQSPLSIISSVESFSKEQPADYSAGVFVYFSCLKKYV